MDRRAFIVAVTGALLAVPVAAEAQQTRKVPRVGVLGGQSLETSPPILALRERLSELGYVEGGNIAIEWRWAQGKERVTPKIVAQFIRRDDIQKSARMRYLFDVDLKDPGLYDVHINTAVLSRGAAVDLLADVARQPECSTTDAGRQLVADRALASQVEVALAGHRDMRRRAIGVESSHGVVTLELPVGADPEVALAVARGVTGVQNVTLRIAEIPMFSSFPG